MTNILYSPMMGKTIALNKVKDDVFSQKLLGDGIAIIPDGKEIYSPIDGIITMIFDTKHAIGIETESGLEILLHIGLDTVLLNGIPFDTRVKIGDQVKKGDLLTVVDWSYIEGKGCDTIVPILVINKKIKQIITGKIVQPGDILFEVED